ncbi:homoserine O-acetyltransferase [Cellulomonas fimi ATCC 484]|uniref:Homoserine O-acetyltransferase n=1 Tax=Cellulomonas fimi (strain ATCC 484 / DSM 20113 / JCM 1341 / CCUG 24087 / LMG 16345 / NBRC 15513 / NCIMB 8980 / NCTC 7547 / NRS-133) TaxID=590998 RepID=F4GY23_CELFA|nr:homoserine O-acetyltransferase [Cellulomonas fimi ATCC 484]VEH27022.1 Homoserine O-acetyltransferase [Cellulomonas fimi]
MTPSPPPADRGPRPGDRAGGAGDGDAPVPGGGDAPVPPPVPQPDEVPVPEETFTVAPSRTRARTLASRVPLPERPPVPASAAWREGDPVGRRRFADLGPFALESGGRLPAVRLAYETWGTLNEDGTNAVLVLHALTGDSHVTGDAGPGHPTPGWWQSMVGPGAPIDTDEWFVVAPNVLGGCQGSTGPASTAPDGQLWGGRFPLLTVRDQVAAEIRLADLLGIDSWALVIGASMGGLRVLEWAVTAPERVRSLAAIATAAQTSGDQIAGFHTQLAAIRADPNYRDGDYYDAPDGHGPHVGLGIARQIAHQTYRSAFELDERFGRIPQGAEDPLEGGRFAVQSYLDHHGDKLVRRFDANSYVVLTRTMITHDLGRDRGGVAAALAQVTARALVVAVDSDRLFPPAQSERVAAGIPGAGPVATIHSDYGHDGFLIEEDQVGRVVAQFLADEVRAR